MYQNRDLGKFKMPKYRKGEKVKFPEGEGTVTQILYAGGSHWYFVNDDKNWSEDELSKISE